MSLQSAQHAPLFTCAAAAASLSTAAARSPGSLPRGSALPSTKGATKTDGDDVVGTGSVGDCYDDRHLRPPPGGLSGRSRGGDPPEIRHLYVLPVLLLEFLAISLTRAVLPSMLLETFGDHVYFVMGFAECIRGLLAFLSCPVFGKLSDVLGRKACLFVTVLGTCAPVCALALMPATFAVEAATATATATGGEGGDGAPYYESSTTMEDAAAAMLGEGVGGIGAEAELGGTAATIAEDDGDLGVRAARSSPPAALLFGGGDDRRMWIFVALLSLSGLFSSTFTLTFAYISDTVRSRDRRVSGFGLALATFGLSFTIGPMAGGYLARVEGGDGGGDVLPSSPREPSGGGGGAAAVHPIGQSRVFTTSLVLTMLDLLYIYFVLPESRPNGVLSSSSRGYDEDEDDGSVITWSDRLTTLRRDVIPETISSWSPLDAFRIFGPGADPLLRRVGVVAFLYYTSLWAVVSTLVLYAAKRFRMGPERLGELMSALGLATMVAEAVLVRLVVPALGERRSIRLGLAAFALQCLVLGLAFEPWHLFACVVLSVLGNLVYPSLTSLVSGAVEPDEVGEALGAVNGVKALTEGVGPLAFGTLMTLSERSALPGWPYLIAMMLAVAAYRRSTALPDERGDDDLTGKGGYLPEKYRRRRQTEGGPKNGGAVGDGRGDGDGDGDEELVGLLSDIDEDEDADDREAGSGLVSEMEGAGFPR